MKTKPTFLEAIEQRNRELEALTAAEAEEQIRKTQARDVLVAKYRAAFLDWLPFKLPEGADVDILVRIPSAFYALICYKGFEIEHSNHLCYYEDTGTAKDVSQWKMKWSARSVSGVLVERGTLLELLIEIDKRVNQTHQFIVSLPNSAQPEIIFDK